MKNYVVVNCPGHTEFNKKPNCIDLRYKNVLCNGTNSCVIKRIIELCSKKPKSDIALKILSMFEIKEKEKIK